MNTKQKPAVQRAQESYTTRDYTCCPYCGGALPADFGALLDRVYFLAVKAQAGDVLADLPATPAADLPGIELYLLRRLEGGRYGAR